MQAFILVEYEFYSNKWILEIKSFKICLSQEKQIIFFSQTIKTIFPRYVTKKKICQILSLKKFIFQIKH